MSADGKKKVYGVKLTGKDHSTEVEIYASVSNREFNDDDRRLFWEVGDSLAREIELNTAKADPEGPAKRETEREQFVSAFAKAGLHPIYVEELPNQYCSRPCCFNIPWFQVTSELGRIVIGWRKRVIEIRIDQTNLPQDTRGMFPDEDTTSEVGYIHAWGIKKAIEYLSVMKSHASS